MQRSHPKCLYGTKRPDCPAERQEDPQKAEGQRGTAAWWQCLRPVATVSKSSKKQQHMRHGRCVVFPKRTGNKMSGPSVRNSGNPAPVLPTQPARFEENMCDSMLVMLVVGSFELVPAQIRLERFDHKPRFRFRRQGATSSPAMAAS